MDILSEECKVMDVFPHVVPRIWRPLNFGAHTFMRNDLFCLDINPDEFVAVSRRR
jgi:hypothetical protein